MISITWFPIVQHISLGTECCIYRELNDNDWQGYNLLWQEGKAARCPDYRAVYQPPECVYIGPFNTSMGKFMQKRAACRTIEQGPNTISCIVWMYLFSMHLTTHHHSTYINGQNKIYNSFPFNFCKYPIPHVPYIIQPYPCRSKLPTAKQALKGR